MTDRNAAAWERVAAYIGGSESLLALLDRLIALAERHEAYPGQRELMLSARERLRALRDAVRDLQYHVWPQG